MRIPIVFLTAVLVTGLPVSPVRGDSVDVVSFTGLVEPSTSAPSDKDGYPPVSGSADPEEALLAARLVVTADLFGAQATLLDDDADGTDDLTVDGDSPRDLDELDGLADGRLAPGTYALYWSLDKTGYRDNLPASSAGTSVQGDVERYVVRVDHLLGSFQSPVWTVTAEGSASINQNDLDLTESAVPPTPPQGSRFRVRSKYRQSSSGGMSYLTAQIYYDGAVLRVESSAIYFYDTDGGDPGSVASGVPPGWSQSFVDGPSLGPADMPAGLSSGDHWVVEYSIFVHGAGSSGVHPYVQTRQAANSNWKVDSGYGVPDSGSFFDPCDADATPPVIVCPPDVVVAADANCQAVVPDLPAASDDCAGAADLTVSCDAPPVFPLGETIVTCTATDPEGNQASCTWRVLVEDRTPPVIVSGSGAGGGCLWAPNHKYVCLEVGSLFTVEDNCDDFSSLPGPSGGAAALTCSSNQPEDDRGDGAFLPDCVVALDGISGVCLRSERLANDRGNRVYTVTLTVTDAGGNASTGTYEVIVTHDGRERRDCLPVSPHDFVGPEDGSLPPGYPDLPLPGSPGQRKGRGR